MFEGIRRTIGQALTSQATSTTDVIAAIDNQSSSPKDIKGEKIFDVLGGFLEPINNRLSTDKWISPKLLNANREWVFRNNDVIAQEVSKMNFELYRVGLQDGEIAYTEIENHPLLSLLDKPNNEEVKSDALYIINSHKKLAGDSFWLKIRTGKTTTALRHLQPDKITLDLQQPTENDPTAIKSYTYHDVINSVKIEITYQPEDIIHFKKPNPNNPFRGLGIVEAMAETIDVDNLTNLTTKNFFKKGAITNFVLTTEQKITRDQLKRLRAELRQDYTGPENAYKTMILGGGLKPEKISFSNKDMEFLSQLEWYRNKIMSGFGNTKAALGLIDDVNRATHESSMIEWKRVTCKPDMEAIVNALNEYLVPEFGEDLILGFTDPIPEDRDDKRTEATMLFSGQVITRNEARELLDYESVEGGDVFIQPSLNTLVDELGEQQDDEEIDQEIEDIENEDDDE